MIHIPDSVPRVDLVGLDHVPGLAHLAHFDGPSVEYTAQVFSAN